MLKRKTKRFSLLISIFLMLSIAFTNLVTLVAYAKTTTGESRVHAEEVEINLEGDNMGWYMVMIDPSVEFTSFSLELEFPSFIKIESITTNYELGTDVDGRVNSSLQYGPGQFTYDSNGNEMSIALTSLGAVNYQTRLFTVEISSTEEITQSGEVVVKDSQFIDFEGNEINVNFELGAISVLAKQSLGKMGDMDGDEDVDMIDLITVQRSITDLSGDYALDDTQAVLADINRDGKVDIKDCQLIRKYIAGLLNSLENGGEQAPTSYKVSVYTVSEEGYASHDTDLMLEEGTDVFERVLQYAMTEGYSVYKYCYDLAGNTEIKYGNKISGNLDVYVFVVGNSETPNPDPESPTSYEINAWFYDENGYTASSPFNPFTVPAGEYLVPYLREIALGYGVELYSVYANGSMQEPIDEYMIVDEYVNEYGYDVWVTFSNGENGDGGNGGNGDEAREFTVTIYVNNEEQTSLTVPAGTSIRSTAKDWFNENASYMGDVENIYYFIDGSYVDETHLVDADVSINIVTRDNQSKKHYIILNFIEGDKQYDFPVYANEGDRIYDCVANVVGTEGFNRVKVISFDPDGCDIVSSEHRIDSSTPENLEVYVFLGQLSEENNLLNIRICSKGTGDEIICLTWPTYEGRNILETIREALSAKSNIEAVYNDDNFSPVGEGDCYGQDSVNDIIVYAYRFEIVMCYSKDSADGTILSAYAFEGDYIDDVARRVVFSFNNQYTIDGVYLDEQFTEIAYDNTVSGDTRVYAIVYEGGIEDRTIVIGMFMQEINGNLTGLKDDMEYCNAGDDLISVLEEMAVQISEVGYQVLGYYHDRECLTPVKEGTLAEQGRNVIYIKVGPKDYSGTYSIMGSNGTVNLNQDGSATLNYKGEFTGEWTFFMGMLLVNVGEYSQYIFELVDEKTAAIFYEFNGENEVETEEFKAFAGTYISIEAGYEDGNVVYEEKEIVLYPNGVFKVDFWGLELLGKYSVVEGNLICLSQMDENSYYDIDKENFTATQNNLVDDVNVEYDVYEYYWDSVMGTSQNVKVGTFTIKDVHGNTDCVINGVSYSGKAHWYSGSYDVLVGEYGLIKLQLDMQEVKKFQLIYVFDGNDNVADEQFTTYVGTYKLVEYHSDWSITFYENGIFKKEDVHGYIGMGYYEIYEDHLKIYEGGQGFSQIRYDEEAEAYVVTDYVNGGGENTEEPDKGSQFFVNFVTPDGVFIDTISLELVQGENIMGVLRGIIPIGNIQATYTQTGEYVSEFESFSPEKGTEISVIAYRVIVHCMSNQYIQTEELYGFVVDGENISDAVTRTILMRNPELKHEVGFYSDASLEYIYETDTANGELEVYIKVVGDENSGELENDFNNKEENGFIKYN